jgi:hypothetical protein
MQTWDEAIQVAKTLHAVDWDPATPGSKMGVCFHKPLASQMGNYTTSYMLLSILGSMTQHRGVSQGLLLDPQTLAPLVSESRLQQGTQGLE